MSRAFFAAAILLQGSALRGEDCDARSRPLREPIRLELPAPQGIARDAAGHYWITSALSAELLELDEELEPVGRVLVRVPPVPNPFANHFAGIASDPRRGTLYLSRPATREIWEVETDGSPTGFVVPLDLPPPVNDIPVAFPKGIAFDPAGAGGTGSFWVVETVMTRIYEVTASGEVLRSFCHPDDRDGCPGSGRAAPSNGVGLVREDAGLFVEVVGGEKSRERIVRVTTGGETVGVSFPLGEAGGSPGGFLRERRVSPRTGEEVDVLLVTVESSAELHVLEAIEPGIRPILDLRCSTTAEGAELAWRSADAYDEIEIRREGALVDSVSADAESWADPAPPHGILRYEVVARKGACETRASCSLTHGTGQVLDTAFAGDRAVVDLTEDASGLIWATRETGEVIVFDKGLELLASLEGPFRDPEDITSGIAFNPRSSAMAPAFFVYNAATNVVVEMDDSGLPIAPAFPSGVGDGREEPAPLVSAMLFDPEGDAGGGSFWYLDHTSGLIEERARSGELLRLCEHPDRRAEPPPPASSLTAHGWGLSTVPGGGFDVFELGGGRIRDGGATRFFRLSVDGCRSLGLETPVAGIAQRHVPGFLGLLRTTHEDRPVLFVASGSRSGGFWISEVDASRPPVPVVRDLRAAQEGSERAVTLRFTVDGVADSVEVRRDGVVIAELPADASVHVDSDVPAGLHEYALRCRLRGVLGDDRRLSLRVGPGSIARREFAHPVRFIHQLARDPVDDVFVAASTGANLSGKLHVFDTDLASRGSVKSPFPFPWRVAALAVRETEGRSEYLSLGWVPGSPPRPSGEGALLPVRVTDSAGRFLREFSAPFPEPPGPLVVFPSGMAWDASSDTLWILERNSGTVLNVDLEGRLLSSFPHPAPIHQDGVIDYGIAVDAERGLLYLASARRLERKVTRIVELTRSGFLTGFEVPLDDGGYDSIRGFSLDASGRNLVASVSSSRSSVHDLAVYRMFGGVEPPVDLSCTRTGSGEGSSFRLTWVNTGEYDAITVYRGREPREEIGGGETSWIDPEPPASCGVVYRVVPRRGGVEGAGAVCEALSPRAFVRGDVDGDGRHTITDAIVVLGFLFLGDASPGCLDAADVDDSGRLEVTDAIALLEFLFRGGPAPDAPYPRAGCDPTGDSLTCSRENQGDV